MNNRQRRADKRKKAAKSQSSHDPYRRQTTNFTSSPPKTDADRVGEQLNRIWRSWPEQDGVDTHALSKLMQLPQTIVNRAVLATLQPAIDVAWKNGWQPADLERYIRLRLSATHALLVVDLIADEARKYDNADTDVDPEWMRQLHEIEAQRWWSEQHDLLSQWQRRHQFDIRQSLTTALELAIFLASLPGLPKVRRPPSLWTKAAGIRAQQHRATLDEAGQRMLQKVRSLLAKAESTSFAEEADVFTAKAQDLMARHAIDHAMLHASEVQSGERKPDNRRIGLEDPYIDGKASLLHSVAEANNCQSISLTQAYFATVIGFREDIDTVELLYTSLLVQATTQMLAAGSIKDQFGRSRTTSFRKSFLYSYASRIGDRLQSVKTEAVRATETTGASVLPVLASKDDAVEAEFKRLFPHTRTSSTKITNKEGWIAGKVAADAAVLDIRDAVPQA